MRVEISLIGDPLEHADAIALAEKVNRVLVGRAHKVIDLEMANEWSNGDKTDIDAMVEMVGVLKPSGVKVIGLSSNFEDPIRDGLRRAGGTLLTAHSDRDPGSFKWRQVRQMRDCVVAGSDVMSENEPPGPHASVGGDNSSPLQLALMRATAHIQGCGLWVLHVADMVKGVLDPAHDRHANLSRKCRTLTRSCKRCDESTASCPTVSKTGRTRISTGTPIVSGRIPCSRTASGPTGTITASTGRMVQ
jgi:hypothetical protein